jgi:hypothetical protein
MAFFTSIPFLCFVLTGIVLTICILTFSSNKVTIGEYFGISFGSFFISMIVNGLFWFLLYGFLSSFYEEQTTKPIRYDLVSFITKSYHYAEGSVVGVPFFFVGSYKEGSIPYYYYYMRTIDGIKFCKDHMEANDVFLNETENGSAYVEQTWVKRSSPEWLIKFYGVDDDSKQYKSKTVINFPKGTIKREFETSLSNL